MQGRMNYTLASKSNIPLKEQRLYCGSSTSHLALTSAAPAVAAAFATPPAASAALPSQALLFLAPTTACYPPSAAASPASAAIYSAPSLRAPLSCMCAYGHVSQ